MATVVSPAGFDEGVARRRGAPLPASRRGARLRAGVGLFFSVALLAAAWWLVAPPQLGATTSFVSVDGTSMLPKLRRSDLVALRPAHTYRVGDVVGYRSRLLRRVVLHRIVAIHGGRYTFEGDNNSFLDPEHPNRSAIVGKLWFHIPSAGRLVQALHVPWVAGALAVLLVLIAGLGGGDARLRRDADGRA